MAPGRRKHTAVTIAASPSVETIVMLRSDELRMRASELSKLVHVIQNGEADSRTD